MAEDPIVSETRRLRQEMMDDAGTSVEDLFTYLQKDQQAYRARLVRLPPKTAIPLTADAKKIAG